MKRNYKVFSLLLLLAFASCSFTTKKFSNPDKDTLLIEIITFVLEQGHVDPLKMDDAFSEKLYHHYIKSVDPVKRYFYASDIADFDKYKFELDDQIKNKDLTFFNVVHERLLERIAEGEDMYRNVLSKPFDYTADETFESDYDETSFVTYKQQMRDRWRTFLMFSTISNYDDLLKQEQIAKEEDPSYTVKTKKKLEREARESTLKSLNNYYHDYVDDLTREDYFAEYINTIVEEYDPHTYYLAPKKKEDFDQRMSGKLEGIGARLQKRMDYIKIVELISGGPAWRSNQLDVEDIILKVKQEYEEYPVNIVGMRISDAIEYIKGPKGTKVTLTIKKVDGTIKDVVITRDVVELVETYAKSSIVEMDNYTFGVINLPAFYVDFKDYKNLNAAKDVKKEIEYLKEDGMEGLVLDLRNNGGGSLPTVVEMAGLFIKDGPIVQVHSTGKSKEVLEDKDKSITWDGPLVILVNEVSASASEIMAAAMQDYKRAIIIGGEQTYGKGTVQNVINLNNMLRNPSSGDLGALALTTQKYYRITGGSVQLEGVKSDIVVPGRFSYIDVGEKDTENPLPWDEVNASYYTPWENQFDYDLIVERSKARMSNNDQFKMIDEYAKWVKVQIDETVFSLNYEKYNADNERSERETKSFSLISDYNTYLNFDSTTYEKSLFTQDTTDLKEKRERWHKDLSQDVYIEEALFVLEDLINTSPPKKVAAVNKKSVKR